MYKFCYSRENVVTKMRKPHTHRLELGAPHSTHSRPTHTTHQHCLVSLLVRLVTTRLYRNDVIQWKGDPNPSTHRLELGAHPNGVHQHAAAVAGRRRARGGVHFLKGGNKKFTATVFFAKKSFTGTVFCVKKLCGAFFCSNANFTNAIRKWIYEASFMNRKVFKIRGKCLRTFEKKNATSQMLSQN